MDVEVGQVLNGKYRIVRRIGAGGMATVYEALHTGLGTALAVKVLLPELARVPTLADRFRREARVSATIKSPHVIQVTDVDQRRGRLGATRPPMRVGSTASAKRL